MCFRCLRGQSVGHWDGSHSHSQSREILAGKRLLHYRRAFEQNTKWPDRRCLLREAESLSCSSCSTLRGLWPHLFFFCWLLVTETQLPEVVSQQVIILARLPDAWISLLCPKNGSDAVWASTSFQLEDNLEVVGLWRSLGAFRGSLLSGYLWHPSSPLARFLYLLVA